VGFAQGLIFLGKRLASTDSSPTFHRFPIFNQGISMARICAITGKRPVKGGRIIRKGLTKKSGGIGTSLVKNTKRRFRPNVQRVRVKLPSGEVKRMWVSVKAIKAGKVAKA
jgi:large subunit ribosomal protein L28